MTTEKKKNQHIDLTIWTFVSKVISLLFNTLSRFVLAFLPRSKCLLISGSDWQQSPSAVILQPKERKSVIASTFLSLFAMKWWDWTPMDPSDVHISLRVQVHRPHRGTSTLDPRPHCFIINWAGQMSHLKEILKCTVLIWMHTCLHVDF